MEGGGAEPAVAGSAGSADLARVIAYYEQRIQWLTHAVALRDDALRVDDAQMRRVVELAAPHEHTNVAVKRLLDGGPLYVSRLLNLLLEMERAQYEARIAALNTSCVTMGRQLIEAQAKLRAFTDERAVQQALLDRAYQGACATVLPHVTDKSPLSERMKRDALLEYFEQARSVLLIGTPPGGGGANQPPFNGSLNGSFGPSNGGGGH